MTIDRAYDRLISLISEPPDEDAREINESCTRFKLIDPMLTDILGWPRACVDTEISGGQAATGGVARLDYLLRDDEEPWFVVEAKKRTQPIVDPNGHAGAFNLDGPVLRSNVLPIAEDQMAPYIGAHLPAFGIITTGEQWVGFLAASRPRTAKLRETRAFVFRSLDHVREKFELFYRCFAAAEVHHRYLEAELRTGVGTITCATPARGVALEADRPLSYQHQTDENFYSELRRAMSAAFTNVGDDPATLEACFVQSRQSREADSRLQMIANELETSIEDAGKYPPLVEQQIKDQPGAAGRQVPTGEELRGQGCLARLLGSHSAGKTWFLRRFYETQLTSEQRRKAIVVRIDAEKFEPFDADRVSACALELLRDELFGSGGPTWEQLVNVYAKEWRTWLRPQGIEAHEALPGVRSEFARQNEASEKSDPSRALYKYAEFAVRNRGRLPCFIVDNADGAERAKHAADWVIALHKNTFSMTTLAIDEESLWRLRSNGEEDLVARHAPEQFWLPRPKVKEVIENRCQYLSTTLKQSAAEGPTGSVAIGYRRQFTWKVDVDKLASAVSSVLLDDQEISSWLGDICNHDIRDVLDLCKEIVLSPRVRATDLLKGQTTGKFNRSRVMRAIISPKNEQYQNHADDRVMNVFGFWLGDDWAPLLPFRILAYLAHREDTERDRGESFPGFVEASDLLRLCEQELRTPRKLAVAVLERLRSQALIELDNPSHRSIDASQTRAHVTPRGRLHLEWSKEPTYARMMAEVDPISAPDVASQMKKYWSEFLGATRTTDANRTSSMHGAEVAMISCYVDHVVKTAERLSPLRGKLGVAKPAEDELIGHWLNAR